MARWTCPACDREFGRAGQSHVCVPECTLEDCFAGRPAERLECYHAVLAQLTALGPVHVDIVRVGVFLKSDRKIAELRPKARCLSLELVLPRPIMDSRVTKRIRVSEERIVHIIKLVDPAEVDEQLQNWLGEAYDFATD